MQVTLFNPNGAVSVNAPLEISDSISDIRCGQVENTALNLMVRCKPSDDDWGEPTLKNQSK